MNTMKMAVLTALTIGLTGSVFAAPGQVNSINEGKTIKGGVYFNTPGARTTFQNEGGSLHLPGGSVVRGLESNINRVPNGNGGTMYFRAPGNIIRIDGDVDVSAVKNNSLYLGNGGKAFFDAAYLYQTGNVFANGVNGGLIQYNVAAATLAPGAKAVAQGFGGNGGTVSINASGVVDLQRGSIIDTSGKVIGTFDTNVINIVGGLVNNEGLLRANGVAVDTRPASIDRSIMNANRQLANNPTPEAISPGEGTGQILFGPQLEFTVPGPTTTRGGTIRLVATGRSLDATSAIRNHDGTLSSTLRNTLLARHNTLVDSRNGDIVNRGQLQANGQSGKGGGTVLLSAADDILQAGNISANGDNGTNGGDGGTVFLGALGTISSTGQIGANGGHSTQGRPGGNGGLVAFSYGQMNHSGTLQANGGNGANVGHGGLIAFNGNTNPTGIGLIQTTGSAGKAGTVLLPSLSNRPANIRSNNSVAPRVLLSNRNELLVNGETSLLLSHDAGSNGANDQSFLARLDDATIRTVTNPLGINGNPVNFLKDAANMVIAGTDGAAIDLDFANANIAPVFTNLNSLMVQNNGDVTNSMHWSPGIHLVGKGSHDTTFSVGGGHISILSSDTIVNDGFLLTRGFWSGGNIHLAAGKDVINNLVVSNIAFNKDLASAFAPKPGYFSSHGGALSIKAGNDIVNNYRLNSPLAFFDIHPPLGGRGLIFPEFLSAAGIGQTNTLVAGNTIHNNFGAHLSADALTYRRGVDGLENPAHTFGGIITLQATNGINNTGLITASGDAFQGFADGRAEDGPRFDAGTQYADLGTALSRDGDIIIQP